MNKSMKTRNPIPLGRVAVCVIAMAVLAACGGGGDGARDTKPAEGHRDYTIDTAGRLAVTESGAAAVRILDLDSAALLEATHLLDYVPSAIYPSPQGRYVVVYQRTQDQVQFVDGGIWQEDHGDHLHDYRQASRLMTWKLAGPRPTHYDRQAGQQSAVFMDGNASAAPVQNAGIRIFDDAGIAAGALRAAVDLGLPIHGLGEPVDGKLLTVSRAVDAPNALPTHLNLYLRSGNTYAFARQLPTRCDSMHGSFSSGIHTLVGCSDGMLLVRHTGASTVDDGTKLATPLRVGTIAGHPGLPDHFIGIASEGASPAAVTTRFYAVDASAGGVVSLSPQGWTTGRVQRAHGFDRSGQRFFVLDDEGALTVLQRQGAAWTTVARVVGVIPSMPSAAPWPVIASNGAKDEIYLTDPSARQLVVVDPLTGNVKTRHNLGYVPSGLAWLGITR